MIYAQFFNKRDSWTVNLYGKDYTYRGDILNNELYFPVINNLYLGTFLAKYVLDGYNWVSIESFIFIEHVHND
jgi:hypothetical protein